jgi:hypothetical protein
VVLSYGVLFGGLDMNRLPWRSGKPLWSGERLESGKTRCARRAPDWSVKGRPILCRSVGSANLPEPDIPSDSEGWPPWGKLPTGKLRARKSRIGCCRATGIEPTFCCWRLRPV